LKLESLVLTIGVLIVLVISAIMFVFPIEHWNLTAYIFLAILLNSVITLSLLVKKENEYTEGEG